MLWIVLTSLLICVMWILIMKGADDDE